jgi:LPS-assembly protein
VTSKFPPRRLLAVAAALALFGSQADARGGHKHKADTTTDDGISCPLGSFHCAPKPLNYAMCRPNAFLAFYDPTLDKTADRRDTSPMQSSANHVDSSNQTIYHMSGNVKLRRADQQVQADTVDYNDATTDYDARGHVRYQEAGQLLAGTHMRGNTDASRGIADNVRYQMLLSRGNGVAKQGQMIDAEHSRYSMATYSTCDVDHHVWEFRAKSITTNKDTGVGVARNATMRVGNVPFFYLPYVTFPLDDRRKSGFLFPTFGKTSRSGLQLSTPYYLNLAPNYDATIDPRMYSLRGPMLAGEFRYLEPTSKGQINVEYVPHDHGDSDANSLTDTKDDSRYLIEASEATQLSKTWSVYGSYNHASDSNYLYDFGNALAHQVAVYQLASSAILVGSGKWWNASFGGTIYQNLNPFATDATLPYKQLPVAKFSMDVPLSRRVDFGLDSEAVSFSKPGYVEGQRVDIYPYITADYGNSAWFVRPTAAYRYTAYDLTGGYQNYGYNGLLTAGQTSPFTQKSPSRSLPILSLDSGLVFDRSVSLFGQNYTQTLEPRLYYLYVPYRNQNDLPLFNTSLMSFDYWELFTPNQFSGADRQMNANDLTGAITTRLLDDKGVERLSLSFGQIRYFTPQKVQLPNGSTTVTAPTDWSGSDYVAQLNVQLNDTWRLATDYQWNPGTRQTDLGALELQHRLAGGGIFNFSYRFRRGLLEQYTASAVYPLTDLWHLVGSWSYSVKDRETVDALAGVEYDSCCVTLRLVDRNYVNQGYFGFGPAPAGSTIRHRDNAIMFEVVFKGLASSGGQIDSLLHRDILGYQ